jgi:hypothetical protein
LLISWEKQFGGFTKIAHLVVYSVNQQINIILKEEKRSQESGVRSQEEERRKKE